ncbi:MAG: ATP-binding protein [Bacteroidota bacterium]
MEKIRDEIQSIRTLIEASLDLFVTLNVAGEILNVNEAMVKGTGVAREDLIGTSFFNYFTQYQLTKDVCLEVITKGFVSNCLLTLKHSNGTFTEVLVNGLVNKNEAGDLLGLEIVAREISEQKWAVDLRKANKELAFQNDEKEKRAAELVIANEELAFQNKEKGKRAAELVIANEELAFQNNEKEKRAAELVIANKELAFQNKVKEERAAELVIANEELVFESTEKEKRANELVLANKELVFQTGEKEKRAAELVIANYARSLIEASLDPLFTINPAGKITDMNNASVKVTGVSRENLTGTDFFEYFTEPQKAKEGYQQVFANGFVADYPLTIRDHNLTDVLFNGSVYKDDQGNVLGIVVVARDITEQKKNEKELTEAKVFAELATAIAEEAKSKAELATRIATDAVKAKQQFLSNMSHEIRTPMNAIIGFTKVVLKTDLTAKQTEYLNAIKTSGAALIVLINDILDLAKVDAGKMTFEKAPFRLAASISSMVHLFETKIQEKNLEIVRQFDTNIPEVLIGDSVRLHQIILNLMSNAVKFTHKGKITIAVKLLSEDDQKVKIEFSVADTGIGILESKIETIFENFQQASSNTSRLFGGTGLGLAIVKQLVESQGGSIQVKSEIMEGSRFSFSLDFDKTSENAEPETEYIELETDIKNIKILVVEDIALNQLLMKTLLDDFGFERDIAGNGKIAIEKLENETYDIILMDLQMPEMNGFEATEYIRNVLKSNIPIIALTADVTTADLAKCMAVGMNDYIAKPVDERVLYNKIISQVKKTAVTKNIVTEREELQGIEKLKHTDLTYLMKRTKSNPLLMLEMIELYLEQTPPLVITMKQSFQDKDWNSLQAAVHKIIPSLSIMGISKDFEVMAQKVQEFAKQIEQMDGIADMVLKLEQVCIESCLELKEEYQKIKLVSHERKL